MVVQPTSASASRPPASAPEAARRESTAHFLAPLAAPARTAFPASAALLNRNWLIRFSSTTADWVCLISSPGGEVLLLRAGLDADVLVAEQAGGEDARRRVGRELHRAVDLDPHRALVALRVERDRGDPADGDAGAAHRRAHLQPADVVEVGGQGVGVAAAEAAQVGRLEGEEQQPEHAEQHEHADQRLYAFSSHRSILDPVAMLTARSAPRRGEHHRRQHEIHDQRRQRGDDDAARGRVGHALRASAPPRSPGRARRRCRSARIQRS